MRRRKKREKKEEKNKENTNENSGHYVIASSRPPERRPLERRTLAPKVRDLKGVEVEAGEGHENAHEGLIEDPNDNQEDVDGDVTEPGIVDEPDKRLPAIKGHL